MKKLGWKKELSESISSIEYLSKHLKIDKNSVEDLKKSTEAFGLRSTLSFIKRAKGVGLSPLIKQIIPDKKEILDQKGYIEDPLAEKAKSPAFGIIHKYKNRVLVLASGACAINCRYCFRRHYPYSSNSPSLSQWDDTIKYIKQNTNIREVILSGGDPLMLNDERLKLLIKNIEKARHIVSLRIHTRLPIVLPKRVTRKLGKILNNTRLRSTMVVHVNSPHEVNDEVASALATLRGTTILNQSVLLRDVNDNEQDLISLSHRLFLFGAIPYYIHLLDKVRGVSHFNVEQCIGEGLIYGISKELPGYLVPRLAKEIPYLDSKFIFC